MFQLSSKEAKGMLFEGKTEFSVYMISWVLINLVSIARDTDMSVELKVAQEHNSILLDGQQVIHTIRQPSLAPHG
jgi:hypothetical protein